MIYYIILSLLAFGTIFEFFYPNKGKANLVFFLVLSFLLCFIAASRYQTGQDWDAYNYIYFMSNSDLLWNQIEKGYILLNRFFNLITNNYYYLQFFITAVSECIVFVSFYKESKRPTFTIFIYYSFCYLFLIDMTLNRMHLAIAILIIGKWFIKQRKIVFWVLIVFFASLFHITAITAFPLFWVLNKRISKKASIVVLSICLAINLFGLVLSHQILSLVQMISFLPERIRTLLIYYAKAHQLTYNSGFGLIVKYVLYFYIVLMHDTEDGIDLYLLCFLVSIGCDSFARNIDILGRIAFYYVIAGSGIVSFNSFAIIKRNKVSKDRFKDEAIQVFVFLGFFAYAIISFVRNTNVVYYENFIPYKSFFFI